MFIPILACAVVLVAVVSDPGRWWETAALAVAAVMLVAWARWDPPLLLVAPVTILATMASQWSTSLEPGMFLLSLLAIVVTAAELARRRVVPDDFTVVRASLEDVFVTLTTGGQS